VKEWSCESGFFVRFNIKKRFVLFYSGKICLMFILFYLRPCLVGKNFGFWVL